LLRAGDDEQAGGVAIESVDDAGTLGIPTSGGAEREELTGERPG
jgi:hypothetical protein